MADCLLHSIRSASEVAFSRQACRSGDSPLLLQAARSPVSKRRDRRAFMSVEQGCSCTSQGSTKKHQHLPVPLLSSGVLRKGGAHVLPPLCLPPVREKTFCPARAEGRRVFPPHNGMESAGTHRCPKSLQWHLSVTDVCAEPTAPRPTAQ